MKTKIDYLFETSVLDSFEIDSVGHISICVNNDLGDQWFIQTTTTLGWTKINSFGPVSCDTGQVCSKSFNYYFEELEYSEYKIIGRLEKFICDPKKLVSQVIEIDDDEFDSKL